MMNLAPAPTAAACPINSRAQTVALWRLCNDKLGHHTKLVPAHLAWHSAISPNALRCAQFERYSPDCHAMHSSSELGARLVGESGR